VISHAGRVVDGPNHITLLYDLVTRLKEGNGGSVAQKQCAAFDAFGSVCGMLGLSLCRTRCPHFAEGTRGEQMVAAL
jgi:hypothetical protein